MWFIEDSGNCFRNRSKVLGTDSNEEILENICNVFGAKQVGYLS